MHSEPTTQPPLRSVLSARPGVAELLACAVAAVVHIATLGFGFVYDDVPQILKNPAIHAWNFVPQYFTAHVWAAIYPNSTGNYYRPLFLLWLRLNYALFGTEAAEWHLTSVACHVVATWLVFRIAQKLSGDRMTAFVAALVFAVHPAHVENVAWVSGVTDPLMTCFLLGSFLAFLGFRESRRVLHAALSLALFALALLSKETAVVLPVLVFAFALIFRQGSEDPETRAQGSSDTENQVPRLFAAIRACAPYLVLDVIYAVVRLRALGKWSHATVPIAWSEVLLTWPAVWWFYIRHLILPPPLSEFYSLDYVTQATAKAVLVPLALVLAAALALYFVIRELAQKDVARFAVVLIVVPLLPVLDLRSLTVGDIVHDRYLYLPSAGFALLVALAIGELARRMPAGRTSFLPVAATVALAFGFAGRTVVEQMQWADDIALYTRGLESAPANLTVRDNLANALLAANQPARAIPLYLEVLQRNPAFWRSNYNLGFAYYKTANFRGAEDYLRRAIGIDPSDSDQYIYLALAQLQMNKLAEAADSARSAIVRNPQARGYHFVLGLIYEAAEDRARAAAELRTEIAEHPENAAAAAELQKAEGTPLPAKP
jgi:protein O-mannosyl-transferase